MQERAFKGIWIPRELWLSKELTIQEKIMLAEIGSLDNDEGCFASNAYFAEFFGLSKNRVSAIISSLVEKKLVDITLIYKQGTMEIDKRILRLVSEEGVYLKTSRGILENKQGVYSDLSRGILESSEDITKHITKTNNKVDVAQNLFSTPSKKESKAKDIVTMKGMISAFTSSEELQDCLLEYFYIRLKKGLQPNQWKIILDDLKDFTKGNISLAVEKVKGSIAGGYMQIIPAWEKNRKQAFSRPSFDNTAGREVQSAKTVQEVLAKDEQGNLIKF